MVARRVSGSDSAKASRIPARTPDERENQLVEAATDLAEKQLREGSASAQVITHYLKLGSSRERLEQERLRGEIYVAQVKAEHMASEMRTEELMRQALDAMKNYSGFATPDEGQEYDDYPE
jgi:proline dehydrogenase